MVFQGLIVQKSLVCPPLNYLYYSVVLKMCHMLLNNVSSLGSCIVLNRFKGHINVKQVQFEYL